MPSVITITLVFLMSICFCGFLPISKAQEQSSHRSFIQYQAKIDAIRGRRYAELNRNNSKQNYDLKYILLWTRVDLHPFNILLEGQNRFLSYKCPDVKCYVTSNRSLFKNDLKKFDAILFNGRSIHNLNNIQIPRKRSPQQRYIFLCLESAQRFPVCNTTFDNFFNWTATYRLDSDIHGNYFSIENAAGECVGPKINMEWKKKTSIKTTYDELYLKKVGKKTKTAAWFVSNCRDKSDRMNFAKKLQRSLDSYNLTIDIYGECGTLKCPKGNPKCGMLLENDYFFYLSFENSLCEDYVTEKVLTAVEHFTIPIVYGGANYSRFLPPYSYIDGNAMSTQDIAAFMHRLIQSPKLYLEYMWWRDHYSFHFASKKSICNICSALNDETMLEKHTIYKNFREWWYPEYENECRSMEKSMKKRLKSNLSTDSVANEITISKTNYNNKDFLVICTLSMFRFLRSIILTVATATSTFFEQLMHHL